VASTPAALTVYETKSVYPAELEAAASPTAAAAEYIYSEALDEKYKDNSARPYLPKSFRDNDMTLRFKKLHPSFMAEVSPVDLRTVHDEPTLQALRAAMTDFGVLVFHDQHFSYDDQIEFAQRLDGVLHSKTSSSVLSKNRFGNEALTDISNVGQDGNILEAADRRRMNGISNRIWHTDASFEEPAGRSMPETFHRYVPTQSLPICVQPTTRSMRERRRQSKIFTPIIRSFTPATPWVLIFRPKRVQSCPAQHIRSSESLLTQTESLCTSPHTLHTSRNGQYLRGAYCSRT
jgi:hypothetical protein